MNLMPELVATSEDTRVYEICVLLPFPLGQKEEAEVMKAVEGLFDEAGGKQISKDVWGRRGLAYTIGGYDEGNYVVYYYELEPDKLKEIDEALRIVPNVLRHIVVKPPKGYQIVEYSKQYEEWLQSREQEEKDKEVAKEEKLKQKMIAKQKVQAKRAEAKKAEAEPEEKAPVEEEKISEEIDKLIADDDLTL